MLFPVYGIYLSLYGGTGTETKGQRISCAYGKRQPEAKTPDLSLLTEQIRGSLAPHAEALTLSDFSFPDLLHVVRILTTHIRAEL